MGTISLEICPRCKLSKEQWCQEGVGSRGTDGTLYCCERCAKHQGCACLEQLTQEIMLQDDVKGMAEEPDTMSDRGKGPLPPSQVGHSSGTSGTTEVPPDTARTERIEKKYEPDHDISSRDS